MEADLRAELKRLRDVVLRVSAELGGKNQKLKHMEKKLKESWTKLKDMEEKLEEDSTSLSRMREENDHLNHVNKGYKQEIRKLKMTVSENESLMKESENQKKEIEHLCMEINKRDAQLDFKCKQLQVLRLLNTATQDSRMLYTTQASGTLNTVLEKCVGMKRRRSLDMVQVQIDTNGLHKELKDKDSELDNELNRELTLVEIEHSNNHDLQETRKVLVETCVVQEVEKEDDESSLVLLDEWSMEDFGDSEIVECSSSQATLPPITPPESLIDPCSDMPSNSSDLSSALIVPEVTKEDDGKSMVLIDECGKGDNEDSGGLECNAFEDDMFNDMLNDSSDLLPVLDDKIAELEWLPTLVENSLSAGEITLDKDDSSWWSCTLNPVSVFKNSSSCSGGMTMRLSPDTLVPGGVLSKRKRSAVFYQPPALDVASFESCFENQPMPNSYISSESEYFLDSNPPYAPNFNGKELEKKKKKAKKGLRQSMPSYSAYHEISLQQQQQPIVQNQKCLHCETTKTAQWRGGPMGPNTLCNACGVRYKSGRLFPEYRPSNSPTFVASLHSSSHKKILEMRVKGTSGR